jgi:hypothetical protein
MSRPRKIIPTIKLTTKLPEPEWKQLSDYLYDASAGKIPEGSYQTFFTERIREYFAMHSLDLAPFAGCPPGLFIVHGNAETIEVLTKTLKGEIPV